VIDKTFRKCFQFKRSIKKIRIISPEYAYPD
jgi:hypothetical protein